MDTTTLLLSNGFFLCFLLLILLIILATYNPKKPEKTKIKEDIKKIKKQVEED